MQIAPNCVVSLEYSLHLGDGEIIEQSESEPLVYLHGAGQIVPGLERQLEGLGVGDTRQLMVTPGEGFGERDPEGVQTVPLANFGDPNLKPGDEVVGVDEDANQFSGRVERIDGDMVTVDFNHPLAGKTLHFNITVKGVRAATPEELHHGHAHGPGQHHHHR